MTQLKDIAQVLRSKNAGAFVLTIDVVFRSKDDYETVVNTGALRAEDIAAAYRVHPSDVSIIPYAEAMSIKVTMPRKVGSGDLSDSDVYGAQQHVPLMLLEIPMATSIVALA